MINENTPLVGNSTALSYTPPDEQWCSRTRGRNDCGAQVRLERMRQYYRSVFRADGFDVAIRDVAVVEGPWSLRCFLDRSRSRICCQAVSAQFRRSRLHVVVDVDGIAAAALLSVVAGRGAQASGDICLIGAAADANTRSRLIAYVGAEPLLVPLLSVESNLWFVVRLHRQENRGWARELVVAAANFVGLDLSKSVAHLSPLEGFRLQVALELVLDPPVLLFAYPFCSMDLASQADGIHLLSRLCSELGKTVVLSARTLPMALHGAASTLLLLGLGGRMLFSGDFKEAISYFNRLRIPKDVPQPVWKGVLAPTPETRAAEEDVRAVGPASRVYSTLCATPRLSSRFFLLDDLGGPAQLSPSSLHPTAEGDRAPEDGAAVEVATGADLVDLAAEWAESESQTMFYAAKFYDSPLHAALLTALRPAASQLPEAPPDAPSPQAHTSPTCVRRFGVVLAYTLRSVAADAEVLLGVALLAIGLIALTVAARWQREDQGGMQNIRGLIFMAFVLAILANLASDESVRDQLHVALGHRKRRLYGSLSFTVCLGLRIVLTRAVYVALFVPFVLCVVRSSYALAVLVGLVSCTHAALQYLIALVATSRRCVAWVSYAYFGYSIVFSGFLLNLRTLPPALGLLSVVRWGYGAVLHTWLHGKSFECDGASNTSYCYTGDDYLAVEGLQNESVAFSVLVLTGAGASVMVVLFAKWSLGTG
ncbi:ABC transporter-like protein [Novymonas esmeraldas]|uniref:ABC transporter-like protein n=1 Tax=Novymonas esmeraldas TaxID=1808958 RepID=A0AAW0F0A4_9TRYP